jgi:hypothetical protein
MARNALEVLRAIFCAVIARRTMIQHRLTTASVLSDVALQAQPAQSFHLKGLHHGNQQHFGGRLGS